MLRGGSSKIILILVVLGGAFIAQKMGLIDQRTFDQLLGTNSGGSYQQQNQNNNSGTKVRPAPTSTQTASNGNWKLPDDRGSICASDLSTSGSQDKALYDFAKGLGLSYPETFVRVSNHINQTGKLPSCYMRKSEARNLGWSGGPLWGYADGRAIGGDRFGNREGGLPRNFNGKYVEADLDYDGRRRGADRLLFVQNSRGQWQQWVTVNHYDSFNQVPQGR